MLGLSVLPLSISDKCNLACHAHLDLDTLSNEPTVKIVSFDNPRPPRSETSLCVTFSRSEKASVVDLHIVHLQTHGKDLTRPESKPKCRPRAATVQILMRVTMPAILWRLVVGSLAKESAKRAHLHAARTMHSSKNSC